MRLANANSQWYQLFKFDGKHFTNVDNYGNNMRALDIPNSKDEEAMFLKVAKPTQKTNQRWKVIYVDEAEKIATKGMNELFGFDVNRPFYLRSRLPMQRVVQCHGATHVRLNRWVKNNKAQQFFFEPVAKSINSNQWKTYIMEVQSNG